MNKIILSLIFVLGVWFISISQSLQFSFNNDSSSEYIVADIMKVDFDDDYLNLYLNDQSVYSWLRSEIRMMNYTKESVGVEIFTQPTFSSDILIYPNPFSAFINVKFELNISSELQIIVYSNNGSEVYSSTLQYLQKGEHELQIDLSKYSDGIYSIVLASNEMKISKNVVLSR